LTAEEGAILAVLAALQIKHFIFDFVLQRPYSFFQNKGVYGHPAGIIHAGLHGLGSIPAILIMPPGFWIGAAIVVGEFIIHYHIDWTKEQVNRRHKLNAADQSLALGIDQLAHQLTYVAILWVLMAST
jgi:hypothetical protein